MVKDEQYDLLIAGAGASGLSLAYYLTQHREFSGKILLVDKDKKNKNDRTWCFWGQLEAPFQQLVSKSWSFLSYCDEKDVVKRPVDKLGYHMIQGIDFYNYMYDVLTPHPNIDFFYGEIDSYVDLGDEVVTYVDGGRRIFRSRLMANSAIINRPEDDRKYFSMLQHFQGYFIRTKQAKFDPQHAYLMDFRNDQQKHLNFFYMLPMSETEALVEFTIFSDSLEENEYYEENLERYIHDTLQVDDYEITEKERGAIPMTDAPFKKSVSDRVINIGTAGGAVKPTTGYAFVRILEQSKGIADYIAGNQKKLKQPAYNRFRFYDQLLLWILTAYGSTEIGKYIFSHLFRKNNMERILNFLSENSPVTDDIRIFATLPIKPFLKAIAGNIPRWLALHKSRLLGSKTNQNRIPVSENPEVVVNVPGV